MAFKLRKTRQRFADDSSFSARYDQQAIHRVGFESILNEQLFGDSVSTTRPVLLAGYNPPVSSQATVWNEVD